MNCSCGHGRDLHHDLAHACAGTVIDPRSHVQHCPCRAYVPAT